MQTSKSDKVRAKAAAVLRKFPAFSMLATSVELDAFTKVKAMITKMIATLKTQQADSEGSPAGPKTEKTENEQKVFRSEFTG